MNEFMMQNLILSYKVRKRGEIFLKNEEDNLYKRKLIKEGKKINWR